MVISSKETSNGTNQDLPGEPADANVITMAHYLLLALLTLLNILNIVDRQLISSFANYIVPDLGLTNAQYGFISGMVFVIFYSLMGMVMGALADMYNRPRLIAAAILLWSALTAVSGAAKGFVSLVIPRILIAVGESALTPAAMSMLADKFPKAKRGFAAGIYYTGVPIGLGISLLMAGYLGPVIGWRMCFYILGGVGLFLALVILFVADVPRRQSGEQEGADKKSISGQMAALWPALKSSPALSLTIVGGFGAHMIFGATMFDQLWFVQERGFDRAYIAQMTGWLAVFGGVLGNLFGGVGSDIWQRRYGKSRLSFLFWIMLLLAPINIYYRIADPTSFFFWLGVFFTFFQLGVIYGPTLSTIQELAPPEICSTAVAFNILICSVSAFGIAVTLSGYLIDHFTGLGFAQPYTVSMLIFTGLSITCVPAFYLASRYAETTE